jgi:prevent-host-death family protein
MAEVPMAKWQVQEAKTHFSELIDEANKKGPQIITRHGSEHAVVLSITDYRSLTVQRENLKDYLLGGPKVESFEVKRSRDTGRKIRL